MYRIQEAMYLLVKTPVLDPNSVPYDHSYVTLLQRAVWRRLLSVSGHQAEVLVLLEKMLFTAAGIVGLALQQTTGVHASRSGTIVLMLYVLAYPLSQMRRASNASKLEKPGPQHRRAA
jgi:hypothetical protein